MESQVSKTLDDFYNEIEKTSELKSFVTFPLNETNEKSILLMARVEYIVLGSERFIGEPIENLIKSNEIDEIKTYLTSRIESTKNFLLLAKYSELFYAISKNNNYCIESINHYGNHLNHLLINKESRDRVFDIYEIYSKILTLSLPIKYKLQDFKQQYFNALTNQEYSCELKTMLALSVMRYGKKLLKPTEIISLPGIFVELSKNNNEQTSVEHCLELALFYANKIADTSQIQSIHKLMGDLEMERIVPYDSTNLAIEHINEPIYEKAIHHYKLAKQTDTLVKVQKQHEENKTNKHYAVTRSSIPINHQVIAYLENMQNVLDSAPKKIFFLNLIHAKGYLIPSNDLIEDYLNNREPCFAEESMEYVVEDINGNHKPADKREFNKFQLYGLFITNVLQFIWHSLISTTTKKKITCRQLHKYLDNHTALGSSLVKTHQGIKIPYTWLSMVEIGLNSFYDQIKLLQKGKSADWRICIDILSIKFEGILRDMMGINGANITKINNGQSSSFLLEDILRMNGDDMKEAFYTCFDDDDLNLFQYAFSSKPNCLNIRNYIAHGFYLPCDYTLDKALLVFLATLRLAKFQDKATKRQFSKI